MLEAEYLSSGNRRKWIVNGYEYDAACLTILRYDVVWLIVSKYDDGSFPDEYEYEY
jgi:hypothetical protein